MFSKITRNIDELGRVVLPAEFRSALGLKDKDSVDIFLDDTKNTVILCKTVHSCCICNASYSLVYIKNKYICCDCKDSLISADTKDAL